MSDNEKSHPLRKKFERFYEDAIRKGTSKYDLAWQAFTYAQQRLHLTSIAACGLGIFVGLGIGWYIFAG